MCVLVDLFFLIELSFLIELFFLIDFYMKWPLVDQCEQFKSKSYVSNLVHTRKANVSGRKNTYELIVFTH